jgi:hypothetical protein
MIVGCGITGARFGWTAGLTADSLLYFTVRTLLTVYSDESY